MTSDVQNQRPVRFTSQPVAARRSRALGVLRMAIFLVSLPFGILSFVLPVYGNQIGADAVQIGLFFSVFFIMTVLLRPVVGVGLDRYSRRPFLLIGLVGYGTTMAAFAFARQVWVIVVARTLQGVASACLWLAARSITADVSTAGQRGGAFGSIDQSSRRGAILGTFLGFGVLMSLGLLRGWTWLFLGYGLVSLTAALWVWRCLPETCPAAERTADRTADRAVQADPRPIRWSRPWLLLLLVTAVTGASAMMIEPVLIIFLQDRLTADVMDIAAASLPAALVVAFMAARLGQLADRWGRKPVMVGGMAIAAISSFFIPHLASLGGLAALWAVQALCYGAGDPAEQALVADLTGGDQRGRAYGLYTMAGGLGAAVGPLLGGWLYEVTGPQAPFYANGVVLLVCTVVLAALLQIPSPGAGDVGGAA